MGSVHPQVAVLLERAARSPLPQYYDVPPFVSRRIYRETRAAVSPDAPGVGEVRFLLANGPAGPVPMRAYRPLGAAGDAVLPALMFFHGGGWVIGDLDTHDVVCRQIANAAGCAVFSVDYRLAPEAPFPAAVDDCLAATRWVASQAQALGIDATRIAVGGDSAGGNLAAVIAIAARDGGGPALRFQLLVYPAADQRFGSASLERNGEGYLLTKKAMEYFRAHYLPRREDWNDWRASPMLAASLAGLPPALVITAGFDPLVDEGKAYAERMRKEGTAVEYREYPDMIHGFLLFGRVVDTSNEAVATCSAALRTAFGAAS